MFARSMRAVARKQNRLPVAGSFSKTQDFSRVLPLTASTAWGQFARFSTTHSKPTLEEAKAMPREYYEMGNDVLMSLAVEGDHDAHRERLIREIMVVDDVSWDEAQPKYKEISAANKAGMGLATLPYKIGIVTACAGGFASIPLVFHLDTALWFNEYFVTADVAEDKDLETWLEVGSWTWNWMEPPLGQISFFLLTLQFARAQMLNIGAAPYTHWMQNRRADRLIEQFPEYHSTVVSEYAKSDSFKK